jgi:aspartate aminotransferase
MTTGALPLAGRMGGVALSPIMKGTIAAERLRRQGVDVVDLGAGEPDFPTPDHIRAAAHTALDQSFTKYTANAGVLELREAVARRYREDHGVAYAADDVLITAGGKQALFHAAMALFGPGDEVITHVPGWPTISEQVKLAGATPVLVRTRAEDGFAITADVMLSGLTPRTRGIIINSPTNPTGALMSDDAAREVAAAAVRHDLWVVVDLCYDRLVYDEVSHRVARIFSEAMHDRLVLCGSASKSYAMTGWRCGWLAGPRAVAAAGSALQSHETSNASSITQKAAVAALTGPQDCVKGMLTEYRERRDQLIRWLGEEPRLSAPVPRGAFYLFPSVQAFLSPNRCRTSLEFADRLLETEHVVLTAGEAFDAPGYLRLSYAASLDRIREGVTRLIRFARSVGPT